MENTKTQIIRNVANQLLNAELSCTGIGRISAEYPELNINDAYAIQLETVEKKLQQKHVITGKKIGLTSLAMQNLLNVNQPDFGHLFNTMAVKNNSIDSKKLLAPKIEGEIAFILKKDLRGPKVTTEDVISATEYICPAIEIVDSRITNWDINIIDTVADNGSSAMYLLSNHTYKPEEIDLPSIHMSLFKNGEKINEGEGKDVLGNPAFCVAWLANALAEYGVYLKAGEIILSGALSAAISAVSGDIFKVDFQKLGSLNLTVL